MIPLDDVADPTVRAVLAAINAGDRAAFLAQLTPDATMSDDGSERDLQQWIDREIFSAGGHIEVESQSDDGRALVARYRNDTWGEMRTTWQFTVADGRVTHFATGQA
jgi:ketosteroid isomerase-like protein